MYREKFDWKSIGLAISLLENLPFSFVQVQAPGGLYLEGRFNRGFFALRVLGAYIWRDLFSEFYGNSWIQVLHANFFLKRKWMVIFCFCLCFLRLRLGFTFHDVWHWFDTWLHFMALDFPAYSYLGRSHVSLMAGKRCVTRAKWLHRKQPVPFW